MAEFKDRLKEAMKKRDVNQSRLCNMTGIDKSSISNYLSGSYKAKQDKVYLIADALRVDPAWLMGADSVEMEQSMVKRADENDSALEDIEFTPAI